MSEFTIKQDDLEPAIAVTLVDGNGDPVNLTSAELVRFLMRLKHKGVCKVAAEATILDGPAGAVKYAWQLGDTDQRGTFRAEWEVTFPGERPMTFPSNGYDTVIVTADLD